MKASAHLLLAMLVVALAAGPVFAQGQSLSARASFTNQILVITPGKTATQQKSVGGPAVYQIVPMRSGGIIVPLPRQTVRPLPGQIIPPLPGQIIQALPGQLIAPLPGQIIQSRPGQMIPPLPGQIIQPLPGQIIR